MVAWLDANKEWLFSGGGVVVAAAVVGWLFGWISRRPHRRIRAILRKGVIKPYADPALKITRPKGSFQREYFLLFNRSMLRADNIHFAKVVIDRYSDSEQTVIATLDETFGKRKDFRINETKSLIIANGEGGVDWSVWILKKAQLFDKSVLYGSMVYYGFGDGIVGAASLLLVEVNKARFDSTVAEYVNQRDFDAAYPAISRLLDKRHSRIIADFKDMNGADLSEIVGDAMQGAGMKLEGSEAME